jgi:hypothetical protein
MIGNLVGWMTADVTPIRAICARLVLRSARLRTFGSAELSALPMGAYMHSHA